MRPLVFHSERGVREPDNEATVFLHTDEMNRNNIAITPRHLYLFINHAIDRPETNKWIHLQHTMTHEIVSIDSSQTQMYVSVIGLAITSRRFWCGGMLAFRSECWDCLSDLVRLI